MHRVNLPSNTVAAYDHYSTLLDPSISKVPTDSASTYHLCYSMNIAVVNVLYQRAFWAHPFPRCLFPLFPLSPLLMAHTYTLARPSGIEYIPSLVISVAILGPM